MSLRLQRPTRLTCPMRSKEDNARLSRNHGEIFKRHNSKAVRESIQVRFFFSLTILARGLSWGFSASSIRLQFQTVFHNSYQWCSDNPDRQNQFFCFPSTQKFSCRAEAWMFAVLEAGANSPVSLLYCFDSLLPFIFLHGVQTRI